MLKFAYYTGLTVRNGLIAVGGPELENNIVFTALRDDFYGGDTNADSNLTVPDIYSSYGRWNGITFENESLDPYCQLQNVIIRYAYNGGVIANSASPTITYSALKDNRYGLVANGASDPQINYSDIYDNTTLGIQNNSSNPLDAAYNWWGDDSGPTHSSNPGGTGQTISDNVEYVPFLTSGAYNPVAGDVSLNGGIQSYDASLVLKYVVDPGGAGALSSLQQRVADVSNNGLIQAWDASLILQYVVDKIDSFPSEVHKIQAVPESSQGLRSIIALQKVTSGRAIVSDGKAAFGEFVDIPVRIEHLDGMTAAQLIINYEPARMSVSMIKACGAAENMNLAFHDNRDMGELSVALAGSEIIPSDGSIVMLTLKVSEDVKGAVVSPLVIKQFIANETDLTESALSGNIEITGKPVSYALAQNYPNPFNPTTTIRYEVPDEHVRVTIAVYNALGQLVRTLVDETQDAGRYTVVWDGRDNSGLRVSSGTYIYRMRAGDRFTFTRKLLLIK